MHPASDSSEGGKKIEVKIYGLTREKTERTTDGSSGVTLTIFTRKSKMVFFVVGKRILARSAQIWVRFFFLVISSRGWPRMFYV